MTAKEKLQSVLDGNFNLEFEKAQVLRNGQILGNIDETIYIRQGGPFGGIMTVLNYSYAIDELHSLGAMRNFQYGHYDFFANWRVQSQNPLTLLQIENDSIDTIKLTAHDTPTSKDIIMEITVGAYIVRCSHCRYIFD